MSDVITVVPSAKLAFAGYLRGFGGGLGGSEPGGFDFDLRRWLGTL